MSPKKAQTSRLDYYIDSFLLGKTPLVMLALFLISGLLYTACGPSLEDQIDALDGGSDQRQQAQHILLLAKDKAVAPLLDALEHAPRAALRTEVADVLISLSTRLEDARLLPALEQHLLQDPDPQGRSRIAFKLGVHRGIECAGPFLQALQDTVGSVRQQAMRALSLIKSDLSPEHQEARRLSQDSHRETRIEALMIAEEFVAGWVEDAGQEQLKANLAGAEELLNQALAYMPNSKRANYFLGRFYLDNGQQQRGKAILQQHGLLLEALRFKEQPVIDGVLDDAVWAQAVVIDTFYQYGFNNAAAYPSTRKTRAYVGHNSTALFIGMRCEEAHLESILVASRDRDSNQYNQDMVEFFFDANLDRESYVVMFVNSTGAITDAWSKKNEHDRDLT